MVPSKQIFEILQSGGWWDDAPIGVPGFVEKQIRIQTKAGIAEDVARRFAEGVAYGGVTGYEAWNLLKDRFCSHLGHNFVKMSFNDLPEDRVFRNAWRQNSNGNITIDIPSAKQIQKNRIENALNQYKNRRSQTLFDRPKILRINTLELESNLRKAETIDQIQAVWPEGLPYYERRH